MPNLPGSVAAGPFHPATECTSQYRARRRMDLAMENQRRLSGHGLAAAARERLLSSHDGGYQSSWGQSFQVHRGPALRRIVGHFGPGRGAFQDNAGTFQGRAVDISGSGGGHFRVGRGTFQGRAGNISGQGGRHFRAGQGMRSFTGSHFHKKRCRLPMSSATHCGGSCR